MCVHIIAAWKNHDNHHDDDQSNHFKLCHVHMQLTLGHFFSFLYSFYPSPNCSLFYLAVLIPFDSITPL
jgi:hypothetical protein